MNKVKFCVKHNKDKSFLEKYRKYECRDCKNEYAARYRKENSASIKEKNKLYNIKTRERRQNWIRQDRIDNPEKYKKYARKYTLDETKERAAKRAARKYKISLDQFKKLVSECNNVCSICKKDETCRPGRNDRLTNLLIDHCHNSKKVRGLLCFNCNILLGKAKDNIELLESAITYLKKHQ